jgi:hypothetical protein
MHLQAFARGARIRYAQVAFASLVGIAGCSSSDVGERVGAQAQALGLTGSNFEIDTDANLRVDGSGPSLDWANVEEIRNQDTASGPNDESFGQGAKEDTAAPVVVDGGIPPNKSDLKFFGLYQEGNTSSGFLNLFWSRVQDPTGTTNMDFELNQRQCSPGQTPADPDCSANGVTPIRTAGDLLIIYDLAQGGTNPILSIREWTGSTWGPATDLTASNKATGSINSSPIPEAESDGLGAQDARTFGEAQIALSAIFNDPNKCESFGSAYLKSRSSDSFTAALKDFVPPVPVSITNCGRVVVKKTDADNVPLAGAAFTINPPNAATPPVSTLTEMATGVFCIDHLLIGTLYTIHESVTPPGYDPAADQTFTPTAMGNCAGVTGSTPPDRTFVNIAQKGAIRITKLRKHAADESGDHPHAGVDFTVNGVTKTTDANGQACFDGLLFGSYTVHETVPSGYVGEGDKSVTVDNKASCADASYGGEEVTFHNTPLSDLLISVTPQVPGATKSIITCTGLNASTSNDTSASFPNLLPGSYNCTITIDP